MFTFSFLNAQDDDIYILNQAVDPLTQDAGLEVYASCDVYYSGTSGNNFSFELGYYLSTDMTYDASDVLLATDGTSVGTSDPYDDEAAHLTIPEGTSAGTYYILFFADHLGEVSETDETNNVEYIEITVTDPGPDEFTIINQAVDPLTQDVGLQVLASCTQIYSGGSSTTLRPYVGFYLSTDNTYDVSDVLLAEEESTLSNTDTNDDEDAHLTIPTGTSPGTYYIIFFADHNESYTEGDETNNVESIEITVTDPGADDFTIINETVSPTSVYPGGLTDVACTQRYTGGNTATLEPFVGYYLSTDNTYDGSDVLLGDDASTLHSQEKEESESATVTIPAGTSPGTYYILFRADYKEAYTEGDETNNVASVELTVETPPADDFTILNNTVSPTTVFMGATIDVGCEQHYEGGSTTTLEPKVGYYLSTDITYDGSDVLLGSSTSSLSVTTTWEQENETLTIPSETTAGTYYILFFADYDDVYTEGDETNNILYTEITVSDPVDDFYIQNPATELGNSLVNSGGTFEASCNQHYSGPATSNFTVYLGYYLSTDMTYDASDILLADDNSTIGSDPEDGERADVTIPTGTVAGTYYILFFADHTEEFIESDETNNVSYVEITVTDPGDDDFTIQDPAATITSLSEGETTSASCLQAYSGGNTTSLSPELGYYLSTDMVYDASDVLLDTDGSSICATDIDDPENETLTIPAGTNPGTCYILFFADHTEAITETNENNNIAYVEITIIPVYTISASANPAEGGTTTGDGAIKEGETCNLTATVATGYNFVNWTESGTEVSTDAAYSFTVTEDRTLVANFELQSFTIAASANPTENGTVAGDGAYNYGSTAELTATPATGYDFINWTEDGTEVSTDAVYSFTVSEDRTLVANFELQSLTIEVSANPTEGGAVSGDGIYDYGSTAELTATVATDYVFVNWTEDGTEVSTDAAYSFTVTADRILVANFELETFDISASANPVNGGTITGAGIYTIHETAELTATTATGFNFLNWTEDGTEVSTNTSFSFTVTADRVFVANFEQIKTYNIVTTVNPTEGGTTTGAGAYDHDEVAELTATVATGYDFVNWTDDGTEVSTNTTYSFTVTGDRTLVANFNPKSYTISASVNPEESGTVAGTGIYDFNETAELTATPATGYDFVNWTDDGTEVSTNAVFSFTVAGDRTLVANFELQSLTVAATANPTDGGTIAGAGAYNYGSTAELTATTATGYNFVNWTDDGTEVSTDAVYSFTVTTDITLVANFELQSLTVTASANPTEGGTVTGDGIYDYGSTVELTATTATDYNFVNWTEDGTEVSTDATYSFTVTGDRTLVANFELQRFTIFAIASPDEGNTTTGYGTYDINSTVELTAIATTGYNFINWTESGTEVSTNAAYSFTITGDRTLVANFELQSFTIATSVNPTDGGTVTGYGIYDHGSTAELTATAATAYNFINWTEDGTEVSTDATYSFTVSEDRTLVANFELQSFTIAASANPAEGGTITGAGTYNYGATAELTATTATGYDFVNWTEDGTEVSTDAAYNFTVSEARTLVANFELQSFTIAASANPAEGGTITGAGTYNYGAIAELTVTAATGYDFVNWTEDGTEVSTDAAYSFTVSGDRTLVANFSEITSISNIDKEIVLDIYPNPTADFVNVKFGNLNINTSKVEIIVYDILGKACSVYRNVSSTNEIQLDVSNINDGIYYLQIIIDGENLKTKKIIKTN